MLDICYNVRKVGYYGLCQTTTAENKRNWGFCSRSCQAGTNVQNDQPYEEAEFRYFDEAPKGSLFSGSRAFYEF